MNSTLINLNDFNSSDPDASSGCDVKNKIAEQGLSACAHRTVNLLVIFYFPRYLRGTELCFCLKKKKRRREE